MSTDSAGSFEQQHFATLHYVPNNSGTCSLKTGSPASGIERPSINTFHLSSGFLSFLSLFTLIWL